MSEDNVGKIEIFVKTDEEDGTSLDFTTNMPLVEVNFWIDQLKALIVSGDAHMVEE